MLRALLLLLTLWSPARAGTPWDDVPDDADARSAVVSQEVLPAILARSAAAGSVVAAREAFFRGDVGAPAAFPRWDGARLERASVRRGLLDGLDRDGEARAMLRAAELPDVPMRADLAAALTAALDREDRADALARRYLLALDAFYTAHPDLSGHSLDATRASLTAALAAADISGDDPAAVKAAAARAAAADDDLRRLDALALALRARAFRADAPLPDPGEDIALLDAPARARSAAVRLELLAGFTDAPPEATTALLGWLEGPALDAAGRAADGLDTVEAVDGALAALPAAPPGGSAVALARRAVIDARRAALQARHEALVGEQGVEADRAKARAETAREEAAKAEAEGSKAAARRAWVLSKVAEASERATAEWERTKAARAAANDADAGYRNRLGTLGDAAGAVSSSVPAERAKADADATFVASRRLVRELRQAAVEANDRVLAAQGDESVGLTRVADERERLRDELRSALEEDERAALDAWAAALDDEVKALQSRVENARAERDQLLLLLNSAQDLRRLLVRYAGSDERRASRDDVFRDLREEIALLGPSMFATVRDRVRWLREIGTHLGRFNVVVDLVVGSVWILLLAFAWWFARARAPAVGNWVVARMHTARERLGATEVDKLRGPIAALVVPVVDLLAIWLMMGQTAAVSTELWLLLLGLRQYATYRLFLTLFEVAFVSYPDTRPALRALRPDTWSAARGTVRWLVLWVLVRRFVWFFDIEVLHTDVFASVVDFAFVVVGLLLVLWLLYRWEPELRAPLARHARRNRFLAALAAGAPSRVLRPVYGMVDLVVTLSFFARDLAERSAREGSSLQRLLNRVARYQLGSPEESVRHDDPIAPAARLALVAQAADPSTRLDRKAAAEVRDVHAAWRRDERRGLVALVGDRGAGKGTVVDALVEAWEADDMPVVRARLTERLLTEDEVVAWLAGVLGVDGAVRGTDQFVEAVRSQAVRCVVLERVDLAFLRTVDGFQALRALLDLLNAACDRDFFLLTFHRPAWLYLSRLGDLVNVEIFRRVVELEPLGEAPLRALTLGRLERAGFQVDFSEMLRVRGEPDPIEIERGTTAFYRLLFEASGGNPAVALRLFADCLAGEDESTLLYARMADALAVTPAENLGPGDLFVLVALRTQQMLDETELVQVTNMSPANVRSIVRHLVGRGILSPIGSRYEVVQARIPAVTRALNRRQLVKWTV